MWDVPVDRTWRADKAPAFSAFRPPIAEPDGSYTIWFGGSRDLTFFGSIYAVNLRHGVDAQLSSRLRGYRSVNDDGFRRGAWITELNGQLTVGAIDVRHAPTLHLTLEITGPPDCPLYATIVNPFAVRPSSRPQEK